MVISSGQLTGKGASVLMVVRICVQLLTLPQASVANQSIATVLVQIVLLISVCVLVSVTMQLSAVSGIGGNDIQSTTVGVGQVILGGSSSIKVTI